MEKEIRNFSGEFRNIEGSRLVEGYALRFNCDSQDLGGFKETIESTALDGVLENCDVCCWLNHNEDRGILARYRQGSGSLSLSVDENGLKYSFEAPNTALGDELLENIRRGDVSESSFAFSVDKDHWKKNADGSYKRTIIKFAGIYDVSPVYHPAYLQTSVNTRGLEELKEQEKREAEEAMRKADEERKAKLAEYYETLVIND